MVTHAYPIDMLCCHIKLTGLEDNSDEYILEHDHFEKLLVNLNYKAISLYVKLELSKFFLNLLEV